MMHALNKGLLLCLLSCLGSLGSEIYNGKEVSEKQMLYMASLQNDAGKHICGGFLINENFVLSAANCKELGPTSVVLGTHNLRKISNDTMRYSFEMCQHPNFLDVRCGDDIMLLKLTKKAQLSKTVQPVKLPKSKTKIKDNAKCSVAGWGRTKTGGKTVDVLQYVDVSVVNLEACKKDWPIRLPPNVICTGGEKADKGFCKGDYGGPLVCGGLAAGVVSFMHGKACRYPNAPGVYTDISKYLPWIMQILKKQKC